MKKLLKCTSLGLHHYVTENKSEYIRVGLEFLKETGFDAADFNLQALLPADGVWQPVVEQALKDSTELEVPIQVCHLPLYNQKVATDPEYAENFHKRMLYSIDAAKALGVVHAVLHPGSTTVTVRSYDRQSQYDASMAHLAPFAEYAAKVGVDLSLENMPPLPGIRQSCRYCSNAEDLCELADNLGMSICWDFGHANIAGFKQSDALAYIGNRLKVVHIHDNRGIEDAHCAPFMGNVDWTDAMHGLKLAGYEGPLNYEVSSGRVPPELRKEFAVYLAKAADVLMEYIV